MRQGQPQNRRGRGRGTRKSANPLTRSFESNGPDVKIRGTAAHIAEKYVSLARDALVNGDVVQAEGYLQHAEHYNRIIMSSQPTHPQGQGDSVNGAGPPRVRTWSLDSDIDDEDGDDDMQDPAQLPQPQVAREDGPRDGGRREGRDNRDGGQGRDNREGGFGRHGGRRHNRGPNGGRGGDGQPQSYQQQPRNDVPVNGSVHGDGSDSGQTVSNGNGSGETSPGSAGADNSNPENTAS